MYLRALVLVTAIGVPLAACGFGGPLVAESSSVGETGDSETSPANDCGPASAIVDRVIDGDTIVLEDNTHVRYILVNTSEITNGKNECWGEEARVFNQDLVEGKAVTLEYDAECRDVYGRLLAYVSVDGVEVNKTLIEEGYACVLHVPPNGDGRLADYQALEDAARDAGLNMWGACGTIPCDW